MAYFVTVRPDRVYRTGVPEAFDPGSDPVTNVQPTLNRFQSVASGQAGPQSPLSGFSGPRIAGPQAVVLRGPIRGPNIPYVPGAGALEREYVMLPPSKRAMIAYLVRRSIVQAQGRGG